MNAKEATIYMFWVGEKMEAGDELTEDELIKLKEAREIGKAVAMKFFFRLKPSAWEYIPGQAFK